MATVNEKTGPDCARCGSCTVVCPVFRVKPIESLTARGRMFLLANLPQSKHSSRYKNIFSQCLLCGACEQVCSRKIPIRASVVSARQKFPPIYGEHGLKKITASKILSSPTLLKVISEGGKVIKKNNLPLWSGLRLKLVLAQENMEDVTPNNEQTGLTTTEEVSYFSGCLSTFMQPEINRATKQLVNGCGYAVNQPKGQKCCGLAHLSSGKEKTAKQLAWDNICSFAGNNNSILCSCTSCYHQLKSYPQLFKNNPKQYSKAQAFADRVEDLATFLQNKLKNKTNSKKERVKVSYHHPCHRRFSMEDKTAPTSLIKRINSVELIEPKKGEQCCGQGGLFHIGYPTLSEDIFKRCANSYLEKNPKIIVTDCSGCLMQWQEKKGKLGLNVEVKHLSSFLSSYLS